MDQNSAFRITALGLLRKLQTHTKGSVLYAELEDALGSYFRLLDADAQKFASLHDVLRGHADKLQPRFRGASSAAAIATASARTALSEAMREIAVVLLACGEMQRTALDLKVAAQFAISEATGTTPPLISFQRFADFLEKALDFNHQLRKKHVELHQQRMRAMASVVDAQAAQAAMASKANIRTEAPPCQ